MKKVLVVNRSEIAVRIIRAIADIGMHSVAVYAEDDKDCIHVHYADEAIALSGIGANAYLNIEAIIQAAKKAKVDAIHPGYGFLSENSAFAKACEAAGIIFIGPTHQQLEQFGDKSQAIALAKECGVPIMPSTEGGASLEEITQFFDAQEDNGIVIKAVGGGGGRGMRIVTQRAELKEAYARCQAEAKSAFGIDKVYAERLVKRARHIEIQIVGDGAEVIALGERDCTLQRRFQKLVEISPSPVLKDELRQEMIQHALTMANHIGYQSLGTFEFLVEENEEGEQVNAVFIETNPRLQVEHTITEQVTGIDLVAAQLAIAQGKKLQEIGLDPDHPPLLKGFSIQVRVNAESTDAQGNSLPSQGTLTRFELPSGLGVRVDTHAYAGYSPSPHYDTLLAKLIVSNTSPHFADVARRLNRALSEFCIEGVETNLALLQAVVHSDDFVNQDIHTRYWAEHLNELLEAMVAIQQGEKKYVPLSNTNQQSKAPQAIEALDDESLVPIRATTHGVLIDVLVEVGDNVSAGQTVAILEAMKMQHEIVAESAGEVIELRVEPNQVVQQHSIMLVLEPLQTSSENTHKSEEAVDLDTIRPDLQRVIDRHAYLWDDNRPQAVERRQKRGQRTARENVNDLVDPGTFKEYGGLVIAAQLTRREKTDLIEKTPADGLITGVGQINSDLIGEDNAHSAIMAYDATVLAGTQGKRNHIKTDRIVETALRNHLPFVLYGEGGGGRPGDVDFPSISGLHQPSFAAFAELSGEVPVVGVVSGRCFAGNAAFLGCCDVIISDESANIGMAGPAMIEGGGLGIYQPEEIGPASVQYQNGVIDILVKNEAQATKAAKHYLSMFQGNTNHWQTSDARALRQVVPENRLRVYDSMKAIEAIADVDSVIELRGGFGLAIHTVLARIEGKPVGIMASNPYHLGGAIDADAGDKAARFMKLCDTHGLPIVSLIDTPGFMVGPEVEAKAQVRHVSRMFLIGAKLRVPLIAIILRKAYGLGAMAMAGGGFRSAISTISWPTGEFGPMGLEGAVRLGFKKELDAVTDPKEQKALYDQLVDQMYERGHALNVASYAEIDAVIDPAETRDWILKGMCNTTDRRNQAIRPYIDAW